MSMHRQLQTIGKATDSLPSTSREVVHLDGGQCDASIRSPLLSLCTTKWYFLHAKHRPDS